jgi:hypothetical protein
MSEEKAVMKTKNNKRRFLVNVRFAVPKGIFPMSFDACFCHAVGREWADGAGTEFTQPPRRAVRRDLDFMFEKKREATTAAGAFVTVLMTHRLRGKVVVEDLSFDPPRKISAP